MCGAWKEIHDTWQKQRCTIASVFFGAIVILSQQVFILQGVAVLRWEVGGGVRCRQPAELSSTWVRLPLLVLGSKVVCLLGECGGSSTLHFVWLQGLCMGTSPRAQNQTCRRALLATAALPGFYCLFLVFLIHKAAVCKWDRTLSKRWRSKSDQQSSCGLPQLSTLDWKHREWSDMHVLIQSGWKMCLCVWLIQIFSDIIYKRVYIMPHQKYSQCNMIQFINKDSISRLWHLHQAFRG